MTPKEQLEAADKALADARDLLARAASKFICPHCGHDKSRVTSGRYQAHLRRYVRWRHCRKCDGTFTTAESVDRIVA